MDRQHGQRGLTLVELLTTMTVMLVLAGVALPVASTMERRKREIELRLCSSSGKPGSTGTGSILRHCSSCRTSCETSTGTAGLISWGGCT